jgi:preprotein translocase subunit YajC
MSSQSLTTFALIALMAVAFYFLILRPQRKRQQEQQKTQNAITPGTRVMTGSGLFGTVVSVGEKQVVIEISPGVNLTLLKPAISRVVGPEDEDGAQPLDSATHYEPETSELDLPDTRQTTEAAEDLGPSATDVTPRGTNQAPPNPALGNDPKTKE